jgi:hypothetical protein
MLTRRDLEKYRQAIEGALPELGRDDVGVGDVTEPREGVLCVLLSRGATRHAADIPIEKLENHEETKKTLLSALIVLSRAVAREAIGAHNRQ